MKMESSANKLSPMMRAYLQTKENYKDTILFYRLGDFYEMFYEDAIEVSRLLDLTLTEKACGLPEKAPMCGVPYHAADTYIAKLLEAGQKVAICEQVGDPESKSGVMVREVVRVVTPGTITEGDLLEDKRNNYLLSVYKAGDQIGAGYCDITTGEFQVVPFVREPEAELSDLLVRVQPSEVIGNSEAKAFYESLPILRSGSMPKFTTYYDWAYTKNRANENLMKQFGENYANVYELNNRPELVIAAGALIEYLNETQKRNLGNINKIIVMRNNRYLTIDMNTRRNLELVDTIRDRKRYGSLLWLFDKTKTSMGGRKLRKYFDEPLQDSKEINARLDAVDEFVKKIIMRDSLAETLVKVGDIERLSGRIAYGNVNPKDLLALKESLFAVPKLKEALSGVSSKKLIECREGLLDFGEISKFLDSAISPEASALMKEGGYIRQGFNSELDELRSAKNDGKKWIEKLEAKERELTGIKNLRIISNRVFGYFIEVNRSQADNVPLRYERRQTVANNERYVTEELREIEGKIFGSEEKALKLESMLFIEIKQYLQGFVKSFQEVAGAIAELDALLSLANCAVKYNYTKPVINNNIKHIKIVDGRHPVVERFAGQDAFIANDTYLNETTDRTMVITGPNMAGKSTYMRQVAIITFLAHIGSFVPARSAEISITDRIFTRVGASDDLIFGQSTFMVEMSEVATILANATQRSLIVLDEIGRGTSTFDGLSIAWAVVEYVSQKFRAKTLFATHYHELTELEGVLEGVKNYKISVKEIDERVVFLRKIVRGGANKSFGIEVARLAGVPTEVLDRAKEISENLEEVNSELDLNIFKERKPKAENNSKLGNEILAVLRDIDMNRVSPMSAFDTLGDLVAKAKKEG